MSEKEISKNHAKTNCCEKEEMRNSKKIRNEKQINEIYIINHHSIDQSNSSQDSFTPLMREAPTTTTITRYILTINVKRKDVDLSIIL